MDLLTASVGIAQPDGTTAMGLLMLPADTPGISVHPFWSTFALAGAESNEVRLTDVLVTPEQIIAPDPELAEAMDQLTTVGLIWFQMNVCAAYTGIASALVEKVLYAAARQRLRPGRAGRADRVGRRAHRGAGQADRRRRDRQRHARRRARDPVRRAGRRSSATVNQAVELLGGMAYVGSCDVAYLAAASHAIAFHPPSRSSVSGGLLDYYNGYPIVVS